MSERLRVHPKIDPTASSKGGEGHGGGDGPGRRRFRVGILTVSDTSFSDPSTDKSGPVLSSILSSAPHSSRYEVVRREVVNDDRYGIASVVERWCGDAGGEGGRGLDLVITTGGTGFGKRDVTPEALTPLITRPAPGLTHLLISTSLQKTPFAALSRPTCGSTPAGTIIVTLPGSPKGARENLEAVLEGDVLGHALDLSRGAEGSRKVHERVGVPPPPATASSSSSAKAHGHHHHHHHHGHDSSHTIPTPRTQQPPLSHDPSLPTSHRHRQSPYPITKLREALGIVFDKSEVLGVEERDVFGESEGRGLVGYVLAEDVRAERDVPDGESTNVDGYAVRASDGPGIYKVLTGQTHPPSTNLPIPPSHIYRINTGAILPAGTDSVTMVEDTVVHSRTSDGEEGEVEVLAKVEVGENVRGKGSDVRVGERVLEVGDVVGGGGGEVGTLVFVGRRKVKVFRRPRVGVLSTGNGITDLGSAATPSHFSHTPIYDTNRPSLITSLRSRGYEVRDYGIVPDTVSAHREVLSKAVGECDVVVTTGGTSMGEGDLLKGVIERELRGRVWFGRVGMKPGKPTTFATVPATPPPPPSDGDPAPATEKEKEKEKETERQRLIFALPGNPASALVTLYLFVIPCLRKMEGRREGQWHLPRVKVQITTPFPLDPRPEYHRVTIVSSQNSPHLQAHSTGSQRSSRTVSLACANGLVELPSSEDWEGDEKVVREGSLVDAVLIGEVLRGD